MTNPIVHAFFVGRALAGILSEQLERGFTETLSELGKFDAEQRERFRQLTQEVLERAEREEAATVNHSSNPSYPQRTSNSAIVPYGVSGDLQTTIDELRAEIAQLRSELQRYRSRSA
jgi:hypothetical protein